MPSLSVYCGCQPILSAINLLSELRPLTPSGPGMLLMVIFFPDTSAINKAKLFIEIISSEPMLTGPSNSDLVNAIVASTQSSIYKNDLVWIPSPQTSISPSLFAIATFLQRAAGAFSLPSFQEPSGP